MSSRLAIAAAVGGVVLTALAGARQSGGTGQWMDSFAASPRDLSTTGQNPYFILEPGCRLVLEGREDGSAIRRVITVLQERKTIGAFDTRVVEERETGDGKLAEVSRNFFAFEKASGW